MSRLPTVFHVKPGLAAAGSGLLAADRLGLITVGTVITVVTVIPATRQQQAMLDEECMAKGRVLVGGHPRLGHLSLTNRKAFTVVKSDVAHGC